MAESKSWHLDINNGRKQKGGINKKITQKAAAAVEEEEEIIKIKI